MLTYTVSAEDLLRTKEWLRTEVYPKVIEEQKAGYKNAKITPAAAAINCWDDGYPYGGAIGGGLSYEFTDTSLGTVTIAKYGKHELNLTNYDEW
jgi:hypothetical protein